MSEPTNGVSAPRQRVFLVGAKRSGTTWVTLLLSQHQDVVAVQQNDLFVQIARFQAAVWQDDAWGKRVLAAGATEAGAAEGLTRRTMSSQMSSERFYRALRPLAEDLYAQLTQSAPHARVVLDHKPENINLWQQILQVFPQAHFVHVIRDPRSVFCSVRAAGRSWGDPQGFQTAPVAIAREWVEEVGRGRAIARATASYTEVQYEKLRKGGAPALLEVYQALGLAADLALAERAIEACKIDKLRQTDHAPKGFFRKGEAEGWRQEIGRHLRLVEWVCGPLMRELGYAPEHPRPAKPFSVKVFEARGRLRRGTGEWLRTGGGPLRKAALAVLRPFPFVRRLWRRLVW